MTSYVRSEEGDDSASDEDEDWLETVTLPCSLALAIDLWFAWKRGVMPVAGGYLQQPRWWRQVIHLLNQHYNRVPRKGQSDQDLYRDLADGQTAQGWGGLTSEG